MTVTRIDPTIPMLYGRHDAAGEWVIGKGRAMLMIDYSEDSYVYFVISDDATGQVWIVDNRYVRVRGNDSLGTKCENPERHPQLRHDAKS
jgi:hypothetical protein